MVTEQPKVLGAGEHQDLAQRLEWPSPPPRRHSSIDTPPWWVQAVPVSKDNTTKPPAETKPAAFDDTLYEEMRRLTPWQRLKLNDSVNNAVRELRAG